MVRLPGKALLAAAVPLLVWLHPPARQAGEPPARPGPAPAGEAELAAALAEQGVFLDPREGLVAIEVAVEVRENLLEYLLVGSAGAVHEAAFSTAVRPSALNVALLALGLEPGTNAIWRRRDPAPTQNGLGRGIAPYEVDPPRGDGLYLHLAWIRDEELFFFRAEDLVRNLASGQTMTRHRWVYLGSRMIPAYRGEGEEFAADVYQNLISIAFFQSGDTLLTGALPECLDQQIWVANVWLLPERGTRLLLVLARDRLEALPPRLRPLLPGSPR